MTFTGAALSSISKVPISYFVYSSLGFFGRQVGGELPGMWFMQAIQEAGRDPAAIRQTLYRMEAEGEIVARRVGRAKIYAASAYADAEIDAGLERILEPTPVKWDRRWTVVHVGLPGGETHRIARERVIALLAVEGFAPMGSDTFVSPRSVGARLTKALPSAVRRHVVVVNGSLVNADAQALLVALWDVGALAHRYRATLGRLQAIKEAVESGITDRDAFVLRFAVVFDFLGVAWDDPTLPAELLTSDWPGDEARVLAARIYRRLVPAATRYAAALLKETSPPAGRRRLQTAR